MAVQRIEDDDFSLDRARALLAGHFGEDALKRWGLLDLPLVARACGAALSYLSSSHIPALSHIAEVRIYSPEEFMVLDDTTLRNLEIFSKHQGEDQEGVALRVHRSNLHPRRVEDPPQVAADAPHLLRGD